MKSTSLYRRLIIILLLAGAAACDRKLDLAPQNSVDAAGALTTPQDIESAVIGAYSYLGAAPAYGSDFNLTAELLGSEGYIRWLGSFSQYQDIATKAITPDNSVVTGMWNNAYQGVNVANNILAASGIITDDAMKDQLNGEAYFVRATFFFELVRLFGAPWDPATANGQDGVPLILKPTRTAAETLATTPRNSVAEVYEQVLSDLQQAVTLLPETYGSIKTDRARATKYTAYAMLARVYLQQSNYAAARDAANEVIESGLYSLNSGVAAVFYNKNTSESIWEIQQNEQHTAFDANNGLTTFYGDFEESPQGRGDVEVLDDFYNSFDDADARKSQLFAVGGDNAPGPGQLFTTKWKELGQNIPVIRLPEMLLIRAESNIRLGSAVGATPAEDINGIRERAGQPPLAAPTLQDVLAERRRELCFEGFRIHDIRRTKGATGAYAWNSEKLVLPIPQSALEANGNLTQNSGY